MWWSQYTAGLFRSAHDDHGKDEFTPLYMLRRIRKDNGFFFKRGKNNTPSEFEGDDR